MTAPLTRWYHNPLRAITGLIPERIDQGVDYSGTGPILAPGSGTILQTENAGWPGGAFIALQYDTGPAAGDVMYFAENIAPRVQPGQHVRRDAVLGEMGGGIEIGWGDPTAIGASLAINTGQWDAANDPTAFGVSASDFLAGTGAPPGRLDGPVQGKVPAGYDFPGRGQGSIDLNPIGWIGSGVTGALSGVFDRLVKDVEHFAIIVPVVVAAAGLGVLGLYLMTKGPRQAIEERTEQRAVEAAQIAAVAA